MSNLSNIGFNVDSDEALDALINQVIGRGERITTATGDYVCYSDPSGAEIWLQINAENELVGFNPHFRGDSVLDISITTSLEQTHGPMDGALHAWMAPSELDDPESGYYPFVFDLPNFTTFAWPSFPWNTKVQLTAFAQTLSYYPSATAYEESQTSEVKFAAESFIPSGLFVQEEGAMPQALGLMTGTIIQAEARTNQLTGATFYCLLVQTLGGVMDVVADPRFFEEQPAIGGVVQVEAWLSGCLLEEPKGEQAKKSFLGRLFGR